MNSLRAKKKEGIFNLCKSYVRDAFSYVSESRDYIYIVIGFFVLSAIAGAFFASKLGFLDELLREILAKTENLRGIELILFIFSNNLSVAFGGILFGLILGIFPLVNAISNGVVLGYVLAKVYLISGISEFWRILPHGIFELPAVFISLGLGLRLGMFIFAKHPVKELKYRLYNSIKVFFFVVTPLLVVAAVIEGLLIILLK